MKEVGYPQEGLFCWVKSNEEDWLPIGEWGIVNTNSVDKKNWDYAVAPTVAELGYWLPYSLRNGWFLHFENYSDWVISYHKKGEDSRYLIHAITEVNARAKMLLHGLKTNLWKFEEGRLRV